MKETGVKWLVTLLTYPDVLKGRRRSKNEEKL